MCTIEQNEAFSRGKLQVPCFHPHVVPLHNLKEVRMIVSKEDCIWRCIMMAVMMCRKRRGKDKKTFHTSSYVDFVLGTEFSQKTQVKKCKHNHERRNLPIAMSADDPLPSWD